MTQAHSLTAADAARFIRDGRLTAEQITSACLKRIAARSDAVRAWVHLDPDLALDQARAADLHQARGGVLGSLHGVPVGIKDIIDTAAWPTENGTPVFAGRRPGRDAEVVERLRAAGAVIMGKTVTTELAFFGPGATRNPHDPGRTPGGSSSGSAAAVADFQVPLALGTQTAGSIIRPASYCGAVGFKPTFGAVSGAGVLTQSPPLDTIGGYARTVEDVALLIEAMGGPALSIYRQEGREPLRLAFVKSPAWPMGDAAMRAAFEALAARMPDIIETVELPHEFATTGGLQRAVQFHDIARHYGPLLDANPGVISAKLRDVIADGRTVSDAEYIEACAARDRYYAALTPVFDLFDAILTPAATGIAPAGLSSTGSPAFNFLWTYLGCPAISVPALTLEAMPLGVQLVGRRDGDAALLSAAERFQALAAR